jgi:hypothetical protein
MKDLKDLEGSQEVEVDIEVDELVEEDKFIVTIVMRQGHLVRDFPLPRRP